MGGEADGVVIDTFYTVELTVANCDAEVWLNDVPIYRRGEGHGTFAGGPFNELVREGRNELTLVVGPGPTPPSSLLGEGEHRARRPPPEGARAEAIFARYPRGASVGGPDRVVLARAAWEARDDGQPTFFPRVVGAAAAVDRAFGRWAWESAEVLAPGAALDEEVEAVLEELLGLLRAGDWWGLAARCERRSAELTRAYALAPGEKAAELARVMDSESAKPGWGLMPIERGRFALRVCADGRMVECVDAEGLPLLRCRPDAKGEFVSFPTWLARLDGELTVLR